MDGIFLVYRIYKHYEANMYYFRKLRGIKANVSDKLGTEGSLKLSWEKKKKKLPWIYFFFENRRTMLEMQ